MLLTRKYIQNNKMKTKKAMILSVGLFLITLFAVSSALFFVSYKYLDKEPIGKKAFNIIKVYGEGEKYLFYIDQSAKLSASKTIFELANNGGFYLGQDCGAYNDYAIWYHPDKKECFPDYKNEFSKSFNQGMDNYLALFRPNSLVFNAHISGKLIASSTIPRADYSLFFDRQNLIGTSGKNIQIGFYEEGSERESGAYSINPSFNVMIGYDLNEYEKLSKKANDIIEACNSEETDKLDTCVNSYIKSAEGYENWNFFRDKPDERYIGFSVESAYSLMYYNQSSKKIEYKKPIYKFALYIPKAEII